MAGKIDLEDSIWCEQVFDGRNKAYGAYELRKLYSKNMKKSLVFAVIFFSLAIASPLIAKIISGAMPEEDLKIVETNELMAPPPLDQNEPPPPPPPSEPPPPPVRTTIKFTPPVIKKDEEVRDEEPPPVVDEIKAEVSTQTVKGTDEGPPPVEEPQITGTGNEAAEDEGKIFYSVEENPEFPGGLPAIGKFIQKNLRYPPMARETGVSGRVTVTFVVEKDGSTTDVKVLRGIGSGCDEEAVRVVKAMPKWKPGKQNGKPVRVHYVVPIMFALE